MYVVLGFRWCTTHNNNGIICLLKLNRKIWIYSDESKSVQRTNESNKVAFTVNDYSGNNQLISQFVSSITTCEARCARCYAIDSGTAHVRYAYTDIIDILLMKI